jgi:O-acetyl-ADP-ribose deacetylase (regulator of RNase III)
MRLTDTFVVGNTIIEIALADITTIDVDVIVSSICDQLHFGTGVAGAIVYKGGHSIENEAQKNADKAEVGSIITTSAGELSYKSIYHAISSQCAEGTTNKILQSCIIASLKQAREDGFNSIAFPALGTGEMQFNIREAAETLIETVIKMCAEGKAVNRVVFCLLRADSFTAFFREAVKQTVIREVQTSVNDNEQFISKISSLLSSLRSCALGKEAWQEYEDISIKLFESLFSPPLASPKIQTRTDSQLSIRDAVFPNYAENGYWSILDRRYGAQMIVLECKNHTAPIGQEAVNQVSRYLRNDALGKIAFIASRHDPSEEALKARSDVFRDQKVIVIFLSDFDFIQMSELKRVGQAPEIYIQRKVEDFLLKY